MTSNPLQGLDQIVYTFDTPCGLKIYMCPNQNVSNYYATLTTRFGGAMISFKTKKEKDYIKVPAGSAHFLEHLMFQKKNIDVNNYFTNLGIYCNAATSINYTTYEIFGTTNFNKGISFLLQYVYDLYLNNTMVKNEKGIICEEIKMYIDNPYQELTYGLYRNLFHSKNLSNYITGTIESVKKTKKIDLEKCYKTFYHPKNMFLIITGNFNYLEAENIIKETLSKIKFPKYNKFVLEKYKEPSKVVKKHQTITMNIEIPKLKMALKLKKSIFKEVDKRKLMLYFKILMTNNFGKTSILEEELINSSLITSHLSYDVFEFPDYYSFEVEAETKYPDSLEKKLIMVFNDLIINERDIERIKKCMISNYIIQSDNTENVLNNIFNEILFYNDIDYNVLDTINKINIKEMKKITTLIKTNNYSTYIINPKQNKNL